MKKLLLIFTFLFSQISYAAVCPSGQVDSGGVCVSACSILQGDTRTYTWDSYIWGDSPSGFCFGSHSGGAACKMNASGSVLLNVPSGSQYWSRSFTFTGSECDFSEINRFSGDTPEPFPYEGDINQNGVDDDYEDWDGDGLKNGEDPDPYSNQVSDLDENKDGIPDFIENVYDDLAQVQDILYCNSDDEQCQNLRSALNTLASTNSILAATVRHASIRNVGRNDFNSSIGALTQSVNSKTSNILDAINNIDIDVTGGVDNTDLLIENFNGLSNRLHSVDASVESVQYSVNSLFNSFNGIHQHMDQNKSNIVDAINNNNSSVDLSGVESSISDLSSKIDDLQTGSDSVPSGSCSNGFVCTGDTYDCYLAQQAFETKCAINNQRDLFGDVFETALGSQNGQSYIDSANSTLGNSLNSLSESIEKTAISAGDGEQVYLEETDISQYLDTYNQDNGGLNFESNTCPEPIQLDFVLAGVKQMNMQLSLEWLCELALYVRAMLMLGAAMISGRLWFQNY